MKIIMSGKKTQTFEEFLDEHGLSVEVSDRGHKRASWVAERYYAEIPNSHILDGFMLSTAIGNGDTPEEAIADYATRISEERLVIEEFKEGRYEIGVPILVEEDDAP